MSDTPAAFRLAMRAGTDGWAHIFLAPPLQSADQVEGPEIPGTWVELASMRILPEDPGLVARDAFLALAQAMASSLLRAQGVKGEIVHKVYPAVRPGERSS
jgi:hypothetical protein